MPKVLRTISIVLIAIAIGIVIFLLVINNRPGINDDITPPKVINEIDIYNYQLKENSSELYKKLFQELKKILTKEEVDEEAYAKLVAQMFIVDFYTLEDKLTKNEVGGVDLVYSTYKDNFVIKAKDTVYKYIENNIYGDRIQKLPQVSEVNIVSLKQISHTYLSNQKDLMAYEINLTWLYKEDLGYAKEATLIIVHEDNKLSIVEMN